MKKTSQRSQTAELDRRQFLHVTALAGGGVHLVTVPIDYSENMRVLVDELRAHASKNGVQS